MKDKIDNNDTSYQTADFGTRPESAPSLEQIKKDFAGTGNKPVEHKLTPEEEQSVLNKQVLVRDRDGIIHYDNGKLPGGDQFGALTDPNGNLMGGEAAKIRDELDNLKPYEKTERTRLTEMAMRHNAKIDAERAKAKPQKPRSGGLEVGGGDPHQRYLDRHAAFIARNPNAVNPSERAKFLGGSGGGMPSAQTQQNTAADAAMAERNAMLAQDQAAQQRKEKARAGRQAAFGDVVASAFRGLNNVFANGAAVDPNDPNIDEFVDANGVRHRYMTYTVDNDRVTFANNRRRELGGTGDYGTVQARIEIDTNGRPLAGSKPEINAFYSDDGQVGTMNKNRLRRFSIGQMEPILRKAYQTLGYGDEGADRMVFDTMGGHGTMGRSAWEKNNAALAESQAKNNQLNADAALKLSQAAGVGARQNGFDEKNLVEFFKSAISGNLMLAEQMMKDPVSFGNRMRDMYGAMVGSASNASAQPKTIQSTGESYGAKKAEEARLTGNRKAAGVTPPSTGSSSDSVVVGNQTQKTIQPKIREVSEDEKLVKEENDRVGRFKKNGGEIDSSDGKEVYRIENMRYLKKDDLEKIKKYTGMEINPGDNTFDEVNDKVEYVLKVSNEARKAFDEMLASDVERITKEALSKFPNSKRKREEYIENEKNRLVANKTPSTKKEREQNVVMRSVTGPALM